MIFTKIKRNISMNMHSASFIPTNSSNSSNFFFFITLISSVFMLVQIGEAMNSGDSLNAPEIKGLHKKFYDTLVLPIVQKCAVKHVGIGLEDHGEFRKVFCESVGFLNARFTDLDANIFDNVRREIDIYTEKLTDKYQVLLNSTDKSLAGPIKYNVEQMEHKKLILAFRPTYEEFKKVAAKYNSQITEELIEYQKLVYKLLCIGHVLGKSEVIKNTEGQQALAYKQYAINLAILSVHLEPPSSVSKIGEIQKMSENWMKIDGEFNSLTGIHKRFFGTVVLPLVRTCDWHFGFNFIDEILCKVAKDLQKFILEWDHHQKKIATNKNMSERERNLRHDEIGNIWAQIRYAIDAYWERLYNSYYKWLKDNKMADEIKNKVDQMGGKGLMVELQAIYEKFKKEATKWDSQIGNERLECRKDGFEMLCMAKRVRTLLYVNDEAGKQALAYQLFAIHLALHSLFITVSLRAKLIGKFEEISERWIKIAELNNLTGMQKRFYDTVLVPLLHKCDWNFGVEMEVERFAKEVDQHKHKLKSRFAKEANEQKEKIEGEKNLCGTVKNLYELFIELDGECEKVENDGEITKAKHVAARDKLANIINASIVNDDLSKFKQECHASLTANLLKAIQNEVNKISPNREDLTAAFKDTFAKLIMELKKVESESESTTMESREIACKLLLISANMEKVFDNDMVGRQQWAFQQFVAGLVLYSLRLDHPKSDGKKGEILKIAESWLIGTERIEEVKTHIINQQ